MSAALERMKQAALAGRKRVQKSKSAARGGRVGKETYMGLINPRLVRTTRTYVKRDA